MANKKSKWMAPADTAIVVKERRSFNHKYPIDDKYIETNIWYDVKRLCGSSVKGYVGTINSL